MKNPACTVCHSVLDPVAGAFQNYDEEGYFRSSWEGLDSLDGHYKDSPAGTNQEVSAPAGSLRETADVVTATGWLASGAREVGLSTVNDDDGGSNIHVDYLKIRDESGAEVGHYELEELADEDSDHAWTGRSFEICCGVLVVPIQVPSDGMYTVEVGAWLGYQWGEGEGRPGTLRISVGGPFYRHGDTWYRDMRSPGFGDRRVPDADYSLQWLAKRIVVDPRFTEATVKFWWPAVMGSDIAEPPSEGDADFQSRLLASSAQAAEVGRLARGFRGGFHGGKGYNLKDLLTEIALSKWFRADSWPDADAVRRTALGRLAKMRLLTPEELAKKTAALTGFEWHRSIPRPWNSPSEALNWTNAERGYGLLYGGIDSGGIAERGRDLTSIMAGVARRLATQTSCPTVMKELYLAKARDRRLLAGVNLSRTPDTAAGAAAVRSMLAELFETLLGVEADASSPDVQAAFDLFMDVWRRMEASDNTDFRMERCDWHEDDHYFDGILDDAWTVDENGERHLDWDRVLDFIWRETEMPDPHGIARTWVVVLAYLMTDPRYLHL